MKKIFISLAIILLVAYEKSQSQTPLLYVQGNGGSVALIGYDGTNPTLFVDGSIILDGAGSAMFDSVSYLQTTGDITNSAGVFTSTGTEKFSGTSNQTILGSFTNANYFGNAIKANIGNMNLDSNVDMYSLVFATDGTLDVSSGTTLFIKNEAYNSISRYARARYVDVGDSAVGFLKRAMNDITLGHWYAFPLGNNVAGYRRIDINLSSLGTSGASNVSSTIKNGSPGIVSFSKYYPSGFSGTSGGSCTIGNREQRIQFNCLGSNYWKFFGPSDYSYTANVFIVGCGSQQNRVVQSLSNSGAWTATIENTVDAVTDDLCEFTDWSNGASGTIPGGRYKSLNIDMAIAGGSVMVLPVKLISFDAQVVNNSFVRIHWTTASEISNKGFHVMRSTDGINFDEITFVTTKAEDGNSSFDLLYAYDDYDVTQGVYYYRLVQEDVDGTQTKSDIVSAEIKSNYKASISFYPNPSSGFITLLIYSKETSATMCITDILGQVVYLEEGILIPKQGFKEIRKLNLVPGNYQVRVTTADEILNQKLVITN